MTETMTADICIDAFTVAASAVAEAMSTSKKPRKAVGVTSQDPVAHDHKNTAQTAAPDLPELVPMNRVRTDGGTQARVTINETVVKDYADALKEGAKLPPVVLYYEESAEVYWLADGFHRFAAHRMIGRVAISAFVKDGTQRDAKLHAAGANSTHGLPRTNADKRCAVLMLLGDPEWTQWSDREIAKACSVSHPLVADVRLALTGNSSSETPAARTYTTKHGTRATMQTAKVGKSRPAAATSPNPGELAPPAEPAPEIATARPSPEQGAVAVTRVDELLAENAALREQLDDIKADLAETLADNEDMARTIEADERLKAAMAEVARYKALAENAERTLAARSNEFNDRARNVVYWKKRAEKAEKLLANAESSGAPNESHIENAQLRTEYDDLRAHLLTMSLQHQEALDYRDKMRAILETNVSPAETPRQLEQALELTRMLENRMMEAQRRADDELCGQNDFMSPTEDEGAASD